MSALNEPRLWAIVGATGSGKSARIKRVLDKEKPRRVVVWDWKGEYPFNVVASTAELGALMRKHRSGPLRACYRPVRKDDEDLVWRQFDAVCRLVHAWGDCLFIAEELANVTTASRCPGGWRLLSTEGRHEALWIIGTTQSPALVDKTFITNASDKYVGMLGAGSHKKYMADVLDVPLADVRALEPLQWLHKGRFGPAVRADLTFSKGAKRGRA